MMNNECEKCGRPMLKIRSAISGKWFYNCVICGKYREADKETVSTEIKRIREVFARRKK